MPRMDLTTQKHWRKLEILNKYEELEILNEYEKLEILNFELKYIESNYIYLKT